MSRCAVTLAVMLVPALAVAAPADDKVEARRHFEAGLAEARAGAYRDALAEFQRAYDLSPNFAVLYNVARAQEALGDAAAALGSFERYLADGGGEVLADRRAGVTAEMERLRPRTGSIVVRVSPATARVTLDGAALDAAAAARGVRVNIGARKLLAAQEGYVSTEETIMVGGGQVASVSLELVPVPAEPPRAAPPPPLPAAAPEPAGPAGPAAALNERPPSPAQGPRSTGSVRRTLGYVAGAAGLAALAAGAVLYLRARSDLQSAVDAGCTQDQCVGAGASHWQDAQHGVRNARISAGAGAVLLTGGAVLIFAGKF
jgi:tetratricopeptide (TPR) repeat protein